MTTDYVPTAASRSPRWPRGDLLAATGITHSRLEGHTDNYGEDSYNEALSLKRANSVADAWAEGAHVPRSNLVTRGLGKKYPIASNDTAAGRAENRRVTVVISTP